MVLVFQTVQTQMANMLVQLKT